MPGLEITVSDALVERVYVRAGYVQKEASRAGGASYYEAFRTRGVRLAQRRDPRLLAFLERSAERLWKLQQPQISRFRQEGHTGYSEQGADFTEVSQFKQALLLADELFRQEDCRFELFGWLYGAIAEAIYGSL